MLGWERLDVILVTGDAYVDHPSFGVAVVGRYLVSLGLRVGVIAAPDINNDEDFKKLGEPAMFFGVTAGNLDSMIMLHTALKKPRSDDAYAEGGLAGKRPKRATIEYCNRLSRIFPKSKLVIGGIESSLRRFAHYDYWSDKVRRSILSDSGADMLVYGMAERPLGEIISALKNGARFEDLKDIRGTAVMVLEKDAVEEDGLEILPSFEDVARDKRMYAEASKTIHLNQNPWSAKALLQKHGARFLKVNPPALPLSTQELDAVYDLPFTRLPHPSHKGKIPAWEMIRFSVTAMRGCFGGCSFCALTVHQGKTIQSRSVRSIVTETGKIAGMQGFTGYVSDIGGPTANMYKMPCGDKRAEEVCKKTSCIHPKICKNLVTDHSPQIEMLKAARAVKGIKKIFISSGVRYDLANGSPEYIKELARHHVSGQLKVAPEHCDNGVLSVMRKPPAEDFDMFTGKFMEESRKAGLEQYIVPYFISAHPGCGLAEQIELALYLKHHGIRPRQVQDFIPAPMTLAGDMFYSGIDPLTGREVYVPKSDKERRLQRALMQYFKPENAEDVRAALIEARREDLIGHGKGKLVGYAPKHATFTRKPPPGGRARGKK